MDIKLNKNSKATNKIFWIIKTTTIGIFSLALVTSTIIEFETWGLEFLNVFILYWIIGYIISYLIAFISHFVNFFITLHVMYVIRPPYTKILNRIHKNSCFMSFMWNTLTKNPCNTELNEASKSQYITNTFYRFVSPDYFYALTLKSLLMNDSLNSRCPKRHRKNDKTHDCNLAPEEPTIYECELLSKKNRRRDFIIFSNWTNVIISFSLVVVALLCGNDAMLLRGIFTVILFRVVSRIIEIIIAFYTDVVRAKMDKVSLEIGYKSSSLKRGNRISLAFHSYVEIVILYSIIYFLSKDLGYFYTIPSSNDMSSYLDFLLYSLSVSAFNFSFTMDFSTFQKLIHVSQVISNITLVVLSIASYIGIKDNMSPSEKRKWLESR